MCENEPNIKIIQEIMGHRDIQTTMDVYNEATKEKKIESFARLEGKMSIAVT
jgi:integrase